MASTFYDGNQGPPLLHWIDDGLLSPPRPPFMTKYSARHTPEVSPSTSPSNVSSRSLSEKGFGRRDAQRPPTGTDRHNFLCPGDPDNYLHKRRFSVEPIREDADATDDSKADGVYHYEDSAEVGLEGNLEMEIDGLLEELMDYHSKRRATMASAPLLPLPEEVSPSASPRLSADSSLPQLVTANMLFGGGPDTPELISSSPRSSKGSNFSPTRSPSLKSKNNFTPITPPTDGWRSHLSLATVPERRTPTPDHSGRVRLLGQSEVLPPDPHRVPEDLTRDTHTSVPSETRRAHHTNLPPIRTTIPEDSPIHRRGKSSISSEHTIMDEHRSRVESLADQSLSSRFSDDDASQVTEIGYLDPGFDHGYISSSSAVSIRFARLGTDSLPGLRAFGGRYSPTSGISPGSVNCPSPTNVRPTPSPKRGMLQSLFSQNSSLGQKKERKRSKGQDHVKIQPATSRSVDTISFATTSSKSSKDKEKKKREKAERRAQLAAQLKAKQLQQDTEKDLGGPSHASVPGNVLVAWEERGAMYSMDGIF